MTLSPIRAGIDTLVVNFLGELFSSEVERLESAKRLAQSLDEPVAISVFPQEFMMQPRAYGKYSFLLKHPEVRIALVDSTKVPCASVRFTSLGLASGAPEGLMAWVLGALSILGNMRESSVSRADVAVDFQGWSPSVEEMGNVSTHLTFRPIYPNVENPETFQFGKGECVGRLYNKTVEIEHSRKLWWHEVWAYSPDYDAKQEVWRFEGQLRRTELRRLGINTSSQVFKNPGSILDYVMRERISLRVPTGDMKRSRWPEDPRWKTLRETAFDGRLVSRLPDHARMLQWDQLVSRLFGLTATAAAIQGQEDYLSALQQLSFSVEAKMYRGKLDWETEIEKRRRRLLAEL